MVSAADMTFESACPCGSGTYTVDTYEGEWGGTTEHWSMSCAKCLNDFVLFEYGFTEKDKQWRGYVWISTEDNDRFASVGRELGDLEERTLESARAKYLEQWMALVPAAQSKKQLWGILTDNGATGYPSISTFYKHVGFEGMASYWEREFSFRNLARNLAVIGAENSNISVGLIQAEKLREQRDALERDVVSRGFR